MNTPTTVGTQLGTDVGTALGAAFGTLLGQLVPWLFLTALVGLVVFLIVRWFWLWYWRVNEQVALLKSIDARLARLDGQAAAPTAPATQTSASATAAWARP